MEKGYLNDMMLDDTRHTFLGTWIGTALSETRVCPPVCIWERDLGTHCIVEGVIDTDLTTTIVLYIAVGCSWASFRSLEARLAILISRPMMTFAAIRRYIHASFSIIQGWSQSAHDHKIGTAELTSNRMKPDSRGSASFDASDWTTPGE